MPEQTSQTRQQRQREQVLIAWADALMSTTSHYLVKGILPRTGLAVVWGPPKCGKSFWTFDVTVHIALGREYRGRPVRQGTVVYCALEGGGGFGNRIEAWRRQHLGNGGEENVPFYLIKQPFDLIANHQKLITAIRDELGKAAPAVIVIDTLNRALVGDENKSDDMAKFIKALGAVQAAFDCLVLVVPLEPARTLMGKTGAKSTAELSTRAVYVRPLERLRPPADLSADGKQLFLDIVLASEPTQFRASDAPLLSAYVRAVEMERAASAHLEAEGHVIDGKPSPWLAVLAQALKGMATLSHRLRLSPQGRSPTNPKRPPSVSYYDRMRLDDPY